MTRRGVPARFSRDRVAQEAVALVDDEGFEALTLRGVAGRLGLTPAALYTYVTDKDELVALALARILQNSVTEQVPAGWREALRFLAGAVRDLAHRHPVITTAYRSGFMGFPQAQDVARRVLERVVADGFTESRARIAYATVEAFALGQAVTAAADPERAGYFEEGLAVVLDGIAARRSS